MIDTHVPLKVNWEEMKLSPPDETKLLDFYRRYEFRSLLKDLTPTGEARQADRRYEAVKTEKEFEKFLSKLKKEPAFSFDTETTSEDPMRAHLVGLSFCWEPFEAYYVPVASAADVIPASARNRTDPRLPSGGQASFFVAEEIPRPACRSGRDLSPP